MTDDQIDAMLAVFNGGLVKEADPKNARGYTMRYKPRAAMRAALSSNGPHALRMVAEMEREGLVQ